MCLINDGHMECSEKLCLKMSAVVDRAGLQVSKVNHQGCSLFHLYHFKSSNTHDMSINVNYLIDVEQVISVRDKDCPDTSMAGATALLPLQPL